MPKPASKAALKITFYALPFLAYCCNFTGTRGRVSASPSVAPVSAAANVAVNRSHPTETAGLTRFPGGPVGFPRNSENPKAVKAYVRNEAVARGVDPTLALWIVKHESSFNPRAKGDGEASRGLWQISKIYHPEVTDAEAYSVRSSTQWSLDRIRSGKVNEWSSYRNCRDLYEDCPY
jgi:hypothetical protein